MNPQQKKIAEKIKWFSSEMEKLTTLHWRDRLDDTSLYSEIEALEMKLRNKLSDIYEEEECRYCKGKYLPYPIETEHLSCRACNRKIGTNFNKTQFVEACGLNVPEEQSSSKDLKTARGEETGVRE